jgi:heptosyltransferase III
LPVLAALRQQFPPSRLEVLGYPHIAQLALAGGLVDAVRSIEARPLARFFVPGAALAEELAAYFSGFALILSYLYDPDLIFQTNVARCSKAQFIAGPHRPHDASSAHATEILLRPLEQLAIFDADPVPHLSPAIQSSNLNRLALHPGSGSERKNWPESGWGELLRHLVEETPMQLLLVGGEAEGDRLDRLARLLPPSRGCLARSLPLTELADALRTCAAFIGHDSGITHLAAALGAPVLVLWGETPEAVWRPRGHHVQVLRHPEGLAMLPVSVVAARLSELLDTAGVSGRTLGRA